MAGVIQEIDLVISKTKEAQAIRDAEAAGQRIGAATTSGMGRASAGIARIFGGIAAGIAAAFSLRVITNFARASITAAAESEKAWSRLEGAVNKVGLSIDQARAKAEKLGQWGLTKTTFGDEALIQSLATLTQMTGDYEEALAAVPVAADLAAAKQISLEQATLLVGKAAQGNVTGLKRYGIEVSSAANAVAELRDQFGGFAEREGRTFSGSLTRLHNQVGEFREEVGKTLIEAGGGTSVMESLIAVFRSLGKWVNDNREGLARFGQTAIEVSVNGVRFLYKTVANLIDLFTAQWNTALAGAREAIIWIVKDVPTILTVLSKLSAALGFKRDAAMFAEAAKDTRDYITALRAAAAEETSIAAKRQAEVFARNRAFRRFELGGTETGSFGALGGGAGGGVGGGMSAAQLKAAEKEALAIQAMHERVAESIREFYEAAWEFMRETHARIAKDADAMGAHVLAQLAIVKNATQGGITPETTEEAVQALADAQGKVTDELLEQSRAIDEAGRGLLRVADQFGLISERTAETLDNILGVATAVPGLLRNIDMFGKVGGLKGVGGAATLASMGIQVAGMIGGALSGIFGDSPEERARREALLRNTEALHDLEDGLRAANLTGVDAERIGMALARMQVNSGGVGFKNEVEINRGNFEAALRSVGLTMADATRIAEELGIELTFTSKNFSQLANALRLSATVGYADTYAGQIERLNDEFTFLNVDDPIEKLRRLQQMLLGLGAPGLNELRGADLTSEFGRNSAQRQLEILFEQFNAGASRSVLGNLTESEYLDALREFSRSLDEANAAGGLVPGSGPDDAQTVAFNQSVTRVEALRMDAQLGTANYYHARADQWMEQIAMNTAFIAGVRPMSGGGFAGGFAFHGDVIINGAGGDPLAIREAVSAGMLQAISEGLGRQYQQSALAAGNVRL